jgi:hypothetical protein
MGCEIDGASPRWLACNICGVTASRSDMHLVPYARSCASAGSSVVAVAFWSNARAWLALFAAIRDLHVSKSAKSVQVCDGHGIVRADDKNHQKCPNHPVPGLNPSKRHSQFGPKCQSGLRAYAGPRSKIDPTQTNIHPAPRSANIIAGSMPGTAPLGACVAPRATGQATHQAIILAPCAKRNCVKTAFM